MLGSFSIAPVAAATDARARFLRARTRAKNGKSRQIAERDGGERVTRGKVRAERHRRDIRDGDGVPITRRRNSEGVSWYLENDAPYLRRAEGTSAATFEERGSQARVFSIRKEAYASFHGAAENAACVAAWAVGEATETRGWVPSISLIRSPRRPPGFRNAKHSLLLIGQSTWLVPGRVLLTLSATSRKQASSFTTDCFSLARGG